MIRMFRSSFVLLSLFGLGACVVGTPGPGALVNASPEPPGANCPLGGIRIDTGRDGNGNGILEHFEVTSTEYLCNVKADGHTSLIRIEAVPAGGACGDATGSRISSGLDLNDNGILDPDEVRAQTLLCDGEAGTDGADGADGADGLQSLVSVETLAPDPEGACYFGGILVQSGLDLNGNGVLDPEEVTHEATVCSIHVNENMTLIDQSVEPPGPNCEHGGIRFVVGYDANGNGVLDPEEAGPPGFICNEMTVIHGTSTLLDISDATGSQCAFGGYVLRSGPDTNGDGVLSPGEVTSTAVVCNGHDGYTTLVDMAPAGSQCGPEGGHVITSGLDLNRNGVLDPSEVQATGLVCNGQDGFLGYDGKNSLVRIRDDDGLCGHPGGFILEVGLDLNDNGILEPSEVEDWELVCNGWDGYDTLVAIWEETEVCPYGGILVETGRDLNYDGVLQPSEVEHWAYVCDGHDGYDTLVAIWEDTEVCPYGGILVETGRDLNYDGVLQSSEVEHWAYVCDGYDGYDTLVDFADAGFDCPGEGFYILAGRDTNFNGYLDDHEIESSVLVCL